LKTCNNRLILTGALTGAALLLCANIPSAAKAAAPRSDNRPNIVYFYADDLGYGETGPYGQQKIKTPNVDKLAAEGMKFTRHYTGTPVCAPARCNLLTGLHSGHAVVRGNYEFGDYGDDKEGGQMPLPPHTQTVAHILKSAGYATGCVGKWGLGMTDSSGQPDRQGFDYFFGYLDQKQAHNYYPTHLWENNKPYPLKNSEVYVHENRGKKDPNVNFAKYQTGDNAYDHLTSKAVEFVEQHKDEPFFLYFATPLPHLSLQPKAEFLDPYLKAFPDDPAYLGDKGYAAHPHPRAAYAAMITMMDAQLGAVMEKLKELGLDENTLIVFSSDNGPTFDVGGVDTDFFNSTAGLRGRKASVYEGGIREPMIARWPGKIKPGSQTDFMSAQYDFMPTVCEITGTTATQPMDGFSLLPTLLGQPAKQTHDYFYWEFPEHGGQQALIRGDWKIVKQNMRKQPDAKWELYNLKDDPNESKDVAAAHPDIAQQLDKLTREAHWHPIITDWEFVDPVLVPQKETPAKAVPAKKAAAAKKAPKAE
jgi:arylsulfatase A-like enzyme